MKRSLSAILALLLILAPEVRADSIWNVSSGNWNTGSNWSPSGVPGSGTFVHIGTTSTNRTATISTANAFSNGAQIGGSSGTIGTVNVTNGRTWNTGADYFLTVGHNGTGTLNILSGGKVIGDVGIGMGTGTGTVQVSNSGSELVSSFGSAFIGYSSTGTLTVSDGGKVASSVTMAFINNSKGTLNLNGTSGSRGVLETSYVGEGSGSQGATINFNGGILRASGTTSNILQDFETGDVQILSGGAFIDSNGYNIGFSTGLQGAGSLTKQGGGTLTLTGTSSYSGNTNVNGGTLQISSGGSVANNIGLIGDSASSTGTATITGAGSQWINSGNLHVGYDGNGTLNIQNGGLVSAGGATTIGNSSGSQGTVTVSGGTLNSTSYVRVGYFGTGTLNVSSGSVQANNGIFIGDDTGGNGTMSVSGGIVTSTTEFSVGANSTGTLMLTGGTISHLTGFIGRSTGSLGTATVTGFGSQWASSGGLYVGHDGVGTLNVEAGGKVTAPSITLANSGNARATLNLNGTSGSRGVLETSYVSEGTGSQGATINFNGGILRATGNQSNFLQNFETGDVQIQSGGAFVDTQSFNVGISTALQGSGGLTKQGAGTLTLSGASTFTDSSAAESGTLEVTANNALGTAGGSTTVANGAALRLNNVNYTTAEPVLLNGTGLGGGGALVNSGTSTFAGQVTAATNASINAGGGTLNLTGGLVKDGTTLTLTGGGIINISSTGISGASAGSDLVVDGTTANLNIASTYNGPTYIRNAGTLNANITGALPTATRTAIIMDDTGSGGSTLGIIESNAIASLTGPASSILSIANGKTLTVGTTSGTTTFAGALTGSGAILKDGGSIQIFTQAGTYSGSTTISEGTLEVTANNALGTNAAGTSVTNGAALKLTNVNYSTTEAVSINGTGISDGGALVNSGTSTFAGQVTAATNASINAGGGTLNLTGGLVKDGTTATIVGGGRVNITGTGISGASANSDLVVDGTTVVVSAASNYNGPTTVQNSGTFVANAAITTTAVTVNSDSTLSGTGSIQNGTGLVTMNGALVVGDSTLGSPVASQLEISGIGSTVLGGSSTLFFDLFLRGGNLSANVSAADRLKIFGTLDATLGGTLVLGNPAALTGFAAGDSWTLFDLNSDGSLSGTLTLDYSSLLLGPGLTGSLNDATGVFSIAAIPEPGRALLLMLGLTGTVLRRRRNSW